MAFLLLDLPCVHAQEQQLPSEPGLPVDSIVLQAVAVEARFEPSEGALVLDSTWQSVFADRPLSDMLMAATALNIRSFGPGALSTIGHRGGAGRHTAVRWNGMRLNSPLHGTADLNLLPVDGLQEVALDAGASAAAQSGGTPGGLLDLRSGSGGSFSDPGLTLHAGAGAFGQAMSGLEGTYRGASWSGRSSARWQAAQWDFPIRHPDWGDLGRMPALGLERIQLQQDLQGHTADGDRWHAAAAFSHVDRRLAPALFANDQGEAQRDRMGLASFQWQSRPMDAQRAWSYFARAGWAADQVVYQNAVADLFSESEAHSLEAGGGAAWHPGSSWRLEAQAFLRRESGVSAGIEEPAGALPGEADAAIVRWEQRMRGSAIWRPRAAWALRIDLLQDRFGGRWQPLLPALHVRLQDQRGAFRGQVQAGLARHYTRPSFNDLFWNPGGNPDLMPEQGWSADLEMEGSLRHHSGLWSFELQAWRQSVQEWIQWAPGPEGFWAAQNIGRVEGQGLEARLNWQRGTLQHGQWGGQALYAWNGLRPEGGSVLLLQPEQRASAVLHYGRRHGAWTWSAGLRAFAFGERFATTDGSQRLPATAQLGMDAQIEYAAARWQARLSVHLENAGNAWVDAALNRPMPGRWWRLNLALGWKGKPSVGASTPARNP